MPNNRSAPYGINAVRYPRTGDQAMKRCPWLLVIISIISLSGCEKPDESARAIFKDLQKSADQNSPADANAAELAPLNDGTPTEAVTDFLEAFRTGDRDRAERLLTDKARQEASQRALVVNGAGSPTAVFTVDRFEYLNAETGAHVNSTWTDANAEGIKQTHEIVWILRRQTEGWRVAGMAARLPGDSEPLILNFEDREDMEAQQQAAEERLARRDRESLKQAKRLQEPDGTQQKH